VSVVVAVRHGGCKHKTEQKQAFRPAVCML